MEGNPEEVDNSSHTDISDPQFDQMRKVNSSLKNYTNNLMKCHEEILQDTRTTESKIKYYLEDEKYMLQQLSALGAKAIEMSEIHEDLCQKIEEVNQSIKECKDRELKVKNDQQKLSSLLGYKITRIESTPAEDETAEQNNLIRVTCNNNNNSAVISLREVEDGGGVTSSSSENLNKIVIPSSIASKKENVEIETEEIHEQTAANGGHSCIYDLVELKPEHPNFHQIREYLHRTQDIRGLLDCLQYC